MASRVNVNVNVNDLSRTGLRSVRRSLDELNRQMRGLNRRVRLTVPTTAARRDIRGVQRLLRGVPNNTRANITVTTTGTRREARRIAALRRSLPDRHRLRVVVVPPRRSLLTRIGRSVGTTITRHATGPFRMMGRMVSGMLQDGIGQGIVAGFRGAGPVGMAILAGIIMGALAVLGAAMAGILVLAFGGAFVAVGAIFAAQSEKIKKTWAAASESMKKDMQKAAEPLIPVVDQAIKQFARMVDAFAPKLRQFFVDAAPEITRFLGSMEQGFRLFGQKAWKPMTEAFNVFLAAFGPQWEGFMEDLGESFGALGRTVSSRSTEIAMAVRGVLSIIVLLIDTVNFLAEAWAVMLRAGTYAFGALIKFGVAPMVNGVMEAFAAIVFGAERAFSWVPGLGGKLKDARRNFDEFRESTRGNLEGIAQKAFDYGKRLDQANRKRKLEVDIRTFDARLRDARAALKKTHNQKTRSKIKADISDLTRKAAAARAELARIKGKTVNIRVNKYTTEYYASISAGTGRGGLAHGGVVGRAATGGVRSNMTLVGEQGPELVDLAPGSRVRSNPDTRRTLSGGGGGPAVIEIRSGGSRLDDLLVEILRKAIRVRGGDVQLVLGRRS